MSSDGVKEIECGLLKKEEKGTSSVPGGWKKGFDPRRAGNGRKPGLTPFADIIRRRGNEVGKDGRTANEAIIAKVEELARDGVEWAVKLMIERTEGKVKETIDLNHSTPELRQLADDELARIAAGE